MVNTNPLAASIQKAMKVAMKGMRISIEYDSPKFVLRYNQEGSVYWRLPRTPEGQPIIFDTAAALEDYLEHSGLEYAKRVTEMKCGSWWARLNPVIEDTDGMRTGKVRKQVWIEEDVTFVHWEVRTPTNAVEFDGDAMWKAKGPLAAT